MTSTRLGKLLMFAATGGVLLQTTTSCQDTLGSVFANYATSILLQALLGGIAT